MGFELIFAFITGVISFFSPCIIPMIMVYLTTITGFNLDVLLKNGNIASIRKQVFLKTLVFIASFTIVFSLMGGFAAAITASFASKFFDVASILAGVLFVVLGLYYLGIIKSILWKIGVFSDDSIISKVTQRWKSKDGTLSYTGVFVVGLFFTLVCSHCISPTLIPSLMLAATAKDFLGGSLVMLSFSLGLGLAFLVSGIFLSRALEHLRWVSSNIKKVNLIVGLVFLAIGILLLSGNYLSLVSLLYKLIPFQNPGM
ncbi:MAG: cytochrome c biogenesis protein CcdA [Candidatus Micrarchaeota archaeon]